LKGLAKSVDIVDVALALNRLSADTGHVKTHVRSLQHSLESMRVTVNLKLDELADIVHTPVSGISTPPICRGKELQRMSDTRKARAHLCGMARADGLVSV